MRTALLIILLSSTACRGKHERRQLIAEPRAAATVVEPATQPALDPTAWPSPTVEPVQHDEAPPPIAEDMPADAGAVAPTAAPRIASPDAAVDGPDSNGLVP